MAAVKRKKKHRVNDFVKREKNKEMSSLEVVVKVLGDFFRHFDLLQIIPLVGLLFIGLLFIRSTGQQVGGHHVQLFQQQIIYMCFGLVCWFFLLFIDYRWFGTLSPVIYLLAMIILGCVLEFGVVRNNAKRWIDLGSISVQPSEFGKFAVLFLTSWLLSRKKISVNHTGWFLLIILLTAIPFALISMEPDLGTAITLLPMVIGIMFVARLKWLHIFVILTLFATTLAISLPFVFSKLKPYQKERILTFLDPERDPLNRGWNAIQSEIAVGTGGFLGKGYGQGTQATLKYLPQMVVDSDFIFPVIAEETGFVGCFLLIFLFAILLFSILRTAMLAPDDFGRYLCVGVAVLMFTHIFINIGMCIRIIPISGLPLPLISYGGTFLVAILIYLGIVQSVYSHRNTTSKFVADD